MSMRMSMSMSRYMCMYVYIHTSDVPKRKQHINPNPELQDTKPQNPHHRLLEKPGICTFQYLGSTKHPDKECFKNSGLGSKV